MKSRSSYLVFILLIAVLLLSACGPDAMVDLMDELDPENAEPSEAQREQKAGEGKADVYYHYHFNNANIKFKIDIPFSINFSEVDGHPGKFDAQGIFEDWIEMNMTAVGGPTGQCNFTCTIYTKWVAEGQLNLGPNGECQIPMQFTFVSGDNFLDGDCPPEFLNAVDCVAMGMVMADPTIYTFTANKPDLTIQNTNEIRLQAEIKNLSLPKDAKGTCTW